MNTLGKNIRLTSYGESHGITVGAILDGFPAGFEIDQSFIQRQLDRRRPGQSALTTTRNESDIVTLQSGVFEGKTTGAPIHFQLLNKDSNSDDYDHLKNIYRPSHADYSYAMRYGTRDHRGGGRSSARVTAGWVAGGAMVQDFLFKNHQINVSAYVTQIGSIHFESYDESFLRSSIDESIVRCPNADSTQKMIEAVQLAKAQKDSLGGVIKLVISGVPAGIGNPVFDKLSASLAHAMMSINAVKGFEIGGGFSLSSKKGSEVNDSFVNDGGDIKTKSNFSGGIQGGISNGMDIVCNVAFKPTSTIGVTQQTVDSEFQSVALSATGRHDPCVVPRAVPIVETMAALVIGDYLINNC